MPWPPPLEDSPSHMGLRPTMYWGPGRGKASEISLFFPASTCHHTQLYILFSHDLVIFRSNQTQYNASPWVFVMRATMMRNTAKIISFHRDQVLFLFCFLVQIAVAEDLFPRSQSLPVSLSHSTLDSFIFPISQRPFDTLKSVLLDSILVSYLVFLPFLPSRFLLISHKESVSRQTSVTE